MGVDVVEVGVCMRKGLIFMIRTCYRSACEHPFVLGVGVFFLFLYRYFPGLFAFLVSASPVIICTAVLLGALLSFGSPNIPEVEEEVEEEVVEEDEKVRKAHHEVSALKTGVAESDLVVEKDGSFSVENHVENVVEEKEDLRVKDGERNFVIGETSLENYEERGLHKMEVVEKGEFDEVKALIAEEEEEEEEEEGGKKGIRGLLVENSRPESELPGTHLEDPFGASQWKLIKDQDESSDSDGGESSSPDASMADILPMLDELHPLLDSEPPQTTLLFPGDSDDDDSSSSSSSSSSGSEEVENHEEEEDEEEEEQQGRQDDRTKGVVTWTEDDEKNLMDLGNSELERNRRLESLIARRRARKNLRTMVVEKNLIDLDGIDPPFPIAPISTARRNPFDLHYDSNEGIGLPPIPGSAPSVMFPRRNPFDLPYGPLEERPNLSGGSFEEEFLTGHEKDMYFTRHQSFNLGSSFFAEPNQEFRFRPYFTTEQASPEKMGYPTFQRQMSDRSDSKLSALTEAESVSSIFDEDNQKNFIDRAISQEGELIHHTGRSPDHDKPESTSSKEVHVGDIDQDYQRYSDADDENAQEREITLPDSESVTYVHMKPEGGHSPEHDKPESTSSKEVHVGDIDQDYQRYSDADDDNAREREITLPDLESATYVHMKPEGVHSPDHDKPESTSSKEVHVGDNNDQDYQRYSDADDENTRERDTTLPGTESATYVYTKPEVVEEVHSGSISSSSEDEKIVEEHAGDESVEVSNNSRQPSVVDDTNDIIAEGVDDSHTKEPVYDSGPLELEKTLSGMSIIEHALFYKDKGVHTSTSSRASDIHVDGESPLHNEESEQEVISMNEGLWVASTQLNAIEANEMQSKEVTMISEEDVIRFGLSGDTQKSNELILPVVPAVVEPALPNSDSSSSDSESEEERRLSEEENLHCEQDQISLTSFHPVHVGPPQFDVDETGANVRDSGVMSEDSTHVESEKLPSAYDDNHEDSEETSSLSGLSTKEAHVIHNTEKVLVHEHEDKEFSNISALGDDPSSILSDISESKPTTDQTVLEHDVHVGVQNTGDSQKGRGIDLTVEEFNVVEDIKEIDERLLTELDTVGDFSVEARGTNTDQIEQQSVVRVQESHPELQVLEASSTQEAEDNTHKLVKSEALEDLQEPLQVGVSSSSTELPESSSKLQGAEARSIEDIDSTLKLQEEVEASSILEDGKPLSEETEDEISPVRLLDQNPNATQTDLESPVLEARSLDTVSTSPVQLHEEESGEPMALEIMHNEPLLEETDIKSGGGKLANRHFHEGEAEKVTLPVQDESLLEQTEVKSLEFETPSQDSSPTETVLELPVHEARSLEDIDSALEQPHEEVTTPIILDPIKEDRISEETKAVSPKFEVLTQAQDQTRSSLQLPVVDARSLEDIDSPTKQFHEEEVKKPIVLESVYEDSVLEATKTGYAEFDGQDSTLTETSSELPVPETRSIEDIDTALKQFHEEEATLDPVRDKLMLEETNDSPAEFVMPNQDPNPTEPNLGLPDIKEGTEPASKQLIKGELEATLDLESIHDASKLKGTEVKSALLVPSDKGVNPADVVVEVPAIEERSLEHIDLASKQPHNGGHQEKPVNESAEASNHEKPTLLKSVEEDHHDRPTLHESVQSQDSVDVDQNLQVPEATFVGDAHSTPKQLSEDKMEDPLKPTEPEDASAELLTKEDIKLDMEDSVTRETSTKIQTEFVKAETHEASTSGTEDAKKKKRSGKSSSSSGSSSSSSDSD